MIGYSYQKQVKPQIVSTRPDVDLHRKRQKIIIYVDDCDVQLSLKSLS